MGFIGKSEAEEKNRVQDPKLAPGTTHETPEVV